MTEGASAGVSASAPPAVPGPGAAAPSWGRRQWLRLRLGMAVWWQARLLPWRLPRDLPFAQMLALATPPEGSPLRGLAADEIATRVHRTLRRPLLMRDRRCLREGILCYRFLHAAGFAPRLHFGVNPAALQGREFSAHCWVTLDDAILAGDLGVPMVALHVYPATG